MAPQYTREEVDQNGRYIAWKIMVSSPSGPVELTEGRQPNVFPS
jgi:hypothetical protein